MLTYVLARRPDEFGLVPDADGYVKIKDLLKALHEDEGLRYVHRSHLAEIILSVPEAPIEISETRIRARNRETLAPTTEAEALPKVLFTAIRRRAYAVVLEHGVQAADDARIVITPNPGGRRAAGKAHRPGAGHPDGARAKLPGSGGNVCAGRRGPLPGGSHPPGRLLRPPASAGKARAGPPA